MTRYRLVVRLAGEEWELDSLREAIEQAGGHVIQVEED